MKLVDNIREIWYSIKLWNYLRKEAKALKKAKGTNLITANIEHNQAQELYLQGIKKLKKSINKRATTKEEYDAELRKEDNLVDYAVKNETEDYKKFIDNLKQVYVFKKEIPKEAMIDKRIKDYQELRRHKEKREELRKKRKNLT